MLTTLGIAQMESRLVLCLHGHVFSLPPVDGDALCLALLTLHTTQGPRASARWHCLKGCYEGFGGVLLTCATL